MKTGTDAQQAGVYLSECCEYESAFVEGQTLTRCPHCSSLTRWALIEDDSSLAA